MTDANDRKFELPATVRAYLTDPAIRTGVDALLEIRPEDIPPDLRLDEMADYLTARAAAELTKFDWATALHNLWASTWQAALNPAWRPASLEILIAEEFAIAPQACWDGNSFSFYHVRGIHRLYTAVSFDRYQTQIAFSFETEEMALASAPFGDFVWREDDDWTGWLVMTLPFSPAHPDFRIAELDRAVQAALAVVYDIARI